MSNDYIIGMPPGYYDGGTPHAVKDKQLVDNAMNVVELEPKMATTKEESGEGKGLTLFSMRNAMSDYKNILSNAGIKRNFGNVIKVAVLNDVTPSESWNNNYQDSSLENKVNSAQINFLKELRQITGAEGTTEALTDLTKSLFGSGVGGTAASMVTGGARAATYPLEGIINKLGGNYSNVLQGNKVDFPSIWESASYTPSYSFTVRLYDPTPGSKESFSHFIVDPLGMLLALTLPIAENKYTYSFPLMVSASCRGLFRIRAGYIASLDVIKGGEFNSIRWDQKPRMVDIKLTISDLYNTMVAIKEGGENKYVERPTLKNYLTSLREDPKVDPEPVVIDPAGRGHGGSGSSPNPAGYSTNHVTFSDKELSEEQSLLKFDDNPIKKRMPKEKVLPAGQLPSYDINRSLVDDTPDKSDKLKKTDKDSSDSISKYTDNFKNSKEKIMNGTNNIFDNFNNNFKTIINRQTNIQSILDRVRKNINDYDISNILLTNINTYDSSLEYYNMLKENTSNLKKDVESLKVITTVYFNDLENEIETLLEKLNMSIENYVMNDIVLDDVSIFLFLDDTINYPDQIENSLGIDITQTDMNRLKNILYSKMTNLVATFNTKINVKIENNYLSSNYIAKDVRDYINDVCIYRINNNLYKIRDFYIDEMIEYTELFESFNSTLKSILTEYISTLEEFILSIEEELNTLRSYNTSFYTFEKYKNSLIKDNILLITSLLTDLKNITNTMEVSIINEMNTIPQKNKNIKAKCKESENENNKHVQKIRVLFSLINRTLDLFRTILQDYIFINNTY